MRRAGGRFVRKIGGLSAAPGGKARFERRQKLALGEILKGWLAKSRTNEPFQKTICMSEVNREQSDHGWWAAEVPSRFWGL
jgi:hypothetical protein